MQPKWSDLVSLDRTRTLAAANDLLPAWVSLIAIVLIGWQLAKIIWMLVPGDATGSPIVVPHGQVSALASTGSGNVQAIADAHIFGKADPDAPVAVAEPTEELEETNLRDLTLKGTIASDRAEFSIAIIANASKEEKVYVIGDPLASGTTLHAVYPDRVVLNERGEYTNLSLPQEYTAKAPPPVRRTAPTRQTASKGDSIQSVVAKNVSRLADVIRPTPYFVNGQQQGYRVYPGRDRRQFAALGLRPGDLIKEIDGQSLSDPTQAMEIFQSLGKADQVSVTVERNGTPETLVLKTEQLDIGNDKTK